LFGSSVRRYAAALALGALTVLGFAPFGWWPIPIFTLALLILLWRDRASTRATFGLGFAFGLGFFVAGASWIYISLNVYGGMPALLTALLTLIFCAVLALFPALTGYAQAWLGGAWTLRAALTIPACWTVLEWLRGWILTGFPFLSLGYSQVPDSPMIGYAPVLGVYGVSFLVVACAGLVASAWRRSLPVFVFAAVIALGAALHFKQWTQPSGAPITVALMQGNISQDIKFREEMLPKMFMDYLAMTEASAAQLIVLPESAFPVFRHELPEELRRRLNAHARKNGGDVLYGVFDANLDTRDIYNAVLSAGGAPEQGYRKHHLVAFGEFIPAKPLIGWIYNSILHMPLADQTPGPAYQKPLAVAGQQVAVNICYEDAFGSEIIRQLPAATMLVNVSNDGWFGDSLGPQQHLQIAQMRAIETGRYLLRGTNTGITAIVDERGNLRARAPQFEVATLNGTAQGFQGATPYVKWGNYPVIAGALALLVFSVANARRISQAHPETP
jgi:apolipoprotein N-acyltransferase